MFLTIPPSSTPASWLFVIVAFSASGSALLESMDCAAHAAATAAIWMYRSHRSLPRGSKDRSRYVSMTSLESMTW